MSHLPRKTRLILAIIGVALVAALLFTGVLETDLHVMWEEVFGSDISGKKVYAPANENTLLEVHVLDLGQADSIIIRCGEHAMLVDAGEYQTGAKVVDYIKSLGIGRFDYVIATHPHSDHIGAMRLIPRNFTVGEFFMPEKEHTTNAFVKMLDEIEEKNIRLTFPAPGDKITLGDAEITFLSPAPGMEFEDMNDCSIAFIIDFGNVSAVFTGDMGVKPEKMILEAGYDIDCDIVKIGHHGSKTASSREFIEAMSPEYGIITVEKNAKSNLPAKTIVNRYKEYGVKLYRTDLNGTIVIKTDGNDIRFKTER